MYIEVKWDIHKCKMYVGCKDVMHSSPISYRPLHCLFDPVSVRIVIY